MLVQAEADSHYRTGRAFSSVLSILVSKKAPTMILTGLILLYVRTYIRHAAQVDVDYGLVSSCLNAKLSANESIN